MPKRPLLIFPTPAVAGRDKMKPRFGSPNYHFPSPQRQKDKLTPQFESMLESFITDSTAGIEPEYVLVLETTGKIDDFERAIRAVPGLEWLAEIDTDEIKADDDFFEITKIGKRLFYNQIDDITTKQSSDIWKALKDNGFIDKNEYITDKPLDNFTKFIPESLAEYSDTIMFVINKKITGTKEKLISGRLLLSMSNQQTIRDLLSKWNKWPDNKDVLPKKWVEIFSQLKEIRKWNIQDRLRETGIEKYWKEELEIKKGTSSKILFEVEIWYRKDRTKRNEIQKKLEQLIVSENGSVITKCIINEIRFHAIKAELPPENIERVLASEHTNLFKCDDVMFFRPTGQCAADVYHEGVEEEAFQEGEVFGAPVLAILDGDPFVYHSLLENRLIVDDPDDFGSAYQAKGRKHCTAMASLVCHGELDAGEPPLPRPIYVRPIMKPNPDDFINNPSLEHIPKEHFFEDLILRSARRIFEGEGDEEPAAPTIKIINLSICDPARMFFHQLSSCAKLLDWLSEKYQVLFCISAGNNGADIGLEKSKSELSQLTDEDITKHTMKIVHRDIRNHRLMSPADSINALSIGAIHTDKSTIYNQGNRVDILPTQELPSPITAHGYGFRNSINPEIYLPGGRQLYNYITDNQYRINDIGMAPGQKVAAAPVNPGERNRGIYIRGTSNSAALASRGAALIYEVLDELRSGADTDIPDEYMAVVIKSLLVHGASWGNSFNILENCLKATDNSRLHRKVATRYLGYGIPDIKRVIECTERQATAIGYGGIKKNEKHEFRFPLPPSLSGLNAMRRLIITLAWLSPVNAENRKYRKANLSFDPPGHKAGVKRVNADGRQVKNGTIQHEVLEGSEVVTYQDGDNLKIDVVCREDAHTLDESVNYGLAVTLEVAEDVEIPIYEEIRQRIEIPIKIDGAS